MAKKPKTDPNQSAAETAAFLRYNPELSVLTQLLRDAEERRDTGLRQAKSSRQFGVGAVDQAVPQVQKAYAGAQAAIAPSFAQQGGPEAQALQARMGEAQALAESQLAARRVSAVEGEGAARTQTLRDFASDRGKIGARALDLSQEQGAFVSQTLGELTDAAAKAKQDALDLDARLNQSERGSQYGAGIDPDTGLPIPGGKLDPAAKKPAKKWATPDQQATAGDEIQRLLKEARENKDAGEKRGDVADLLTSGIPAGKTPIYETVDDGKGGKKRQKKLVRDASGNLVEATVEDPGFEAAKSQLLASAALDMAYDGHLSRRNQKLLHDRGIQLKPLGLVTYAEWDKQRRASRQPTGRPGTAPGPNGQQRPT